MTENPIEKPIIDRLPMNLRMPFQIVIFKKLGIENDPDKVEKDGKIISDFIDNVKNVVVRELIKERKFDEAADILISEIKKEESLEIAA